MRPSHPRAALPESFSSARWPLWCLSVLPLALVLAGCGNQTPESGTARPVLVQPVRSAADGGSLVLTGEVRARHETDLAFRVGGKVVARLVDAGAQVKAGTPLARLDPADLALAQQAARAQLAAAESDAATAEADRVRYADLLKRKFVSQTAYDARENAARVASARFEQARAQAESSRNQLDYGTLTADRAGVITVVLAESGQVVAAGQPVVRLAQPDEKEVLVAVPEGRLAELRVARNLTVSLWADPSLRLKGELRELSPAADAATRTFAARIRILDPTPAVQLGMTARLNLSGGDVAAGWFVPSGAVFDQGEGPAVWVVVDNKVHRQPVKVRQFREDGVLLSAGLQGNETVVAVGANRLAEGQAVKPMPQEPAR